MRRSLILIALSLGLTACAAPSPEQLDIKRVRSEDHLRKEVVLPAINFPQIQAQLFKHRAHCEVSLDFSLDENQVHYATVRYGTADKPNLADQAVFDLTAFSNGKVQVVGYTYYSQQQFLVDAFLQALSKPEVCAPGITKKE